MARPFELHELVPPAQLVERIQARQRHQLEEGEKPPATKQVRDFVQLPKRWATALDGASGQTWQVAVLLLHLHWKEHGHPIKLGNRASWAIKIPRRSKWRALQDLEKRGLVLIERRSSKAPIIRVFP